MDRNICWAVIHETGYESPPARVAWIETLGKGDIGDIPGVATREGGVDRNAGPFFPRARNLAVATREGGVDRNIIGGTMKSKDNRSPPARVAWIETCRYVFLCQGNFRRHPRGWRG